MKCLLKKLAVLCLVLVFASAGWAGTDCGKSKAAEGDNKKACEKEKKECKEKSSDCQKEKGENKSCDKAA